jgi:YbgC/YbaW family acyl-CoA thioester hydrolase
LTASATRGHARPVTAGPGQPPALHHLDFRLSWGECDPAGIVYFASWLPWMERVHSEWMFLHGERPDQMAGRHGVSMVVRNVTCDYLVPAKVFDPLRCTLHGGRLGTRSVTEAFTITNRDTGHVHARSSMAIVFIDAGGSPAPPPAGLTSLWDRPARA